MTRLRFFSIAVVLLAGTTLCSFAADRDFDGLVTAVAQRYDVHATHIQ
jgi:hypothetical protein